MLRLLSSFMPRLLFSSLSGLPGLPLCLLCPSVLSLQLFHLPLHLSSCCLSDKTTSIYLLYRCLFPLLRQSTFTSVSALLLSQHALCLVSSSVPPSPTSLFLLPLYRSFSCSGFLHYLLSTFSTSVFSPYHRLFRHSTFTSVSYLPLSRLSFCLRMPFALTLISSVFLSTSSSP